MKTVLSNFKYF